MVLPLLVLCVCAFGFVFAPNDPELVDLTKKFLAPCPEFPLGADNLGRCVLSRLLYGGRTTLGIVLSLWFQCCRKHHLPAAEKTGTRSEESSLY